MEKYRIVYYDVHGKPCDAIVVAADSIEALAQVENLGRLCTLTSLGPSPSSAAMATRGASREERLAEQSAC